MRVVAEGSVPTCGRKSFCSISVMYCTRPSRETSSMVAARVPMKLRAASVEVIGRASSSEGRSASTISLSLRSYTTWPST